GAMGHGRVAQPTPIGDIRAGRSRAELREVVVQDVGKGGQEFQIRVLGAEHGGASSVADAIKTGLRDKFGEGTYDVLRVETVGPKVGKDLWRSAALAVLAATVVMGAYIALRFEIRFGVGAAIALLHDVLMTIGALSLANMEFDLTTVAALLTVRGYSVHDTVIVSDRIRENMRKMRRETLATIMNISINETLSRTLITSGTAILVTAALFALGGTVIHSFAFALLVGFVVGTYSSIYVASPVVLYLEGRQTKRRGRPAAGRRRGGAAAVTRRWVRRVRDAAPGALRDVVSDLGVAHAGLVAQLLWNRDVRDRDAAAAFLRPTLAHGLRAPALVK